MLRTSFMNQISDLTPFSPQVNIENILVESLQLSRHSPIFRELWLTPAENRNSLSITATLWSLLIGGSRWPPPLGWDLWDCSGRTAVILLSDSMAYSKLWRLSGGDRVYSKCMLQHHQFKRVVPESLHAQQNLAWFVSCGWYAVTQGIKIWYAVTQVIELWYAVTQGIKV